MPWEVRDSGPDEKKFCVHREGSDDPIACYADRADAVAQVRVLMTAYEAGPMGDAHRAMSKHYATKKRMDAAEGWVQRFDSSPLGTARPTPQGGLRVPATVTRTGIFAYRQPDGSTVREYHPPQVVADSAASLPDAVVTDLHPKEGMVTPDNHAKLTRGHVSDAVHFDAKTGHLDAEIVVQDRGLVTAIKAGQRAELSSGYLAKVVPGPGKTPEGEHYDALVTEIIHNHVGIGPPGWARAGREAALRLDGAGHEQAPATTRRRTHMELRIDGTVFDLEAEPEARAATRALAKLEDERNTLKAGADALQGRCDGMTQELAKAKALNEELTKRLDGVELASAIDAAKKVAPKADFSKVSTPRQAQEVALHTVDKDIRLDGQSDAYVKARFDIVAESLKPNAAEDFRRTPAVKLVREDGETRVGSKAQAAYDAMRERNLGITPRAKSAGGEEG